MANAPIRPDEQILPHDRWRQLTPEQLYWSKDLLIIKAEALKAFCYRCQLDEQWYDFSSETLRDALEITPVDNNRAFTNPPSSDTLIHFVNELGYPKEVKQLSNVITNDMFQPWRAITTIINLCLTRKTSGFERPRAPVLQILWESMANAPVRPDEQILPHDRWVAIGKSNCYLNEERSQLSPIFKIAVDILKQTNFFRAFTESSTIPTIYIQQFWDTIYFDIKGFSYRCQLDEQWYDLSSETLRDALEITPV
nr:hypothetical protein [Tanacetum cinerariifolium]